MPKFTDSSYPKLTGVARADRIHAEDMSQADPAQITRYLEVQDLLAVTYRYASMAIRTTMTGTLTLLNTDSAYQSLNPNGANRTVNLPTAGADNHPFLLVNRAASTYTITVMSGASIVVVLQPGDTRTVVSDGVGWYLLNGDNIHSAADKSTPVDADEMSLWDSAVGLLKKLTFANLKAALKSYFDLLYYSASGWISQNETWYYSSASTFYMSGDKRSVYKKGTKLQWVQSGVTKYGTVVSSSYSAPNTTVTIFVNTDHTLLAASITSNYYSYMEDPAGFPDQWNFAVTWTGLTVGNATVVAKCSLTPNVCKGFVSLKHADVSPTTSITGAVSITPPVTPLLSADFVPIGAVSLIDIGTALYMGEAVFRNGSGLIEVRVIHAGGTYAIWSTISSTIPFMWGASDLMTIDFEFLW